jgi:hypothetical protein
MVSVKCRSLVGLRLIRHGFVQIVALAFLASTYSVPAFAAQSFSSLSITAVAMNALVQAYHATRKETDLEAPFALERCSVEVIELSSKTVVVFFPNLVKGATSITVEDGKATIQHDAAVILNARPTVLPGVTAGEMIAAYRTAMDRNDPVTRGTSEFPFTVDILLGAAGSLVSFVPGRSTTPSKIVCIADCNPRSSYLVRIERGKVNVTHVG